MNAHSALATPHVVDIADLYDEDRRTMYALYERYYDASSWEMFVADLADKDRVVMLRDETGAVRGFSTLAIYERRFNGDPVRVIFSGDTVVDDRYWGQQALALTWLRHAGAVKAERPNVRLFWLLISKGHRTYRYLSAFSRSFHPAPGAADGAADLRAIKDFLARDRFGENYDAATGVVRYAVSRGHLRAAFAGIPAAHRRLPEVAFFLAQNPGYARGEELVCVCEIAADWLRPIARRAFLAGAEE